MTAKTALKASLMLLASCKVFSKFSVKVAARGVGLQRPAFTVQPLVQL